MNAHTMKGQEYFLRDTYASDENISLFLFRSRHRYPRLVGTWTLFVVIANMTMWSVLSETFVAHVRFIKFFWIIYSDINQWNHAAAADTSSGRAMPWLLLRTCDYFCENHVKTMRLSRIRRRTKEKASDDCTVLSLSLSLSRKEQKRTCH